MIVRPKTTDPRLPEDGHAWGQLRQGFDYRVIGIEYGDYRIQSGSHNDQCPTLYSSKLFDMLDAQVEAAWIVDFGDDFENEQHLYIGFQEFREPGFWEDVHDGQKVALDVLNPILKGLGLNQC